MRQTSVRFRLRQSLPSIRGFPSATDLLSRGLPGGATISLRQRWPLLLFFVSLVAQLLMPDPVWSTTAILLGLLHLGGWLWLRAAANGITFTRTQSGALLVVGDQLEELWIVENATSVPLAWLEVRDESNLPDYGAGRVVSVGAHGRLRWRTTALCTLRGRFRIGPHRLVAADPISLFTLSFPPAGGTEVVIYPRALQLPALPLPRGETGGDARTRRPLFGVLPGASVRQYQPHDELRYVHWASTARRASLMVRELELEPTGDLWLLLDTCADAIQPVPPDSSAGPPLPPNTLEFSVSVAAGAAATVQQGSDSTGLGLLAASGDPPSMRVVPPQQNLAHLWTLLGELAPLVASPLRLHDLLQQARTLLPSRSSLLVVTADLADAATVEAWLARLVGVRERGLFASALLVTVPETEQAAQNAQALLARHRIEALLLPAGARLPPALTHRRRRTVIRSSPLGRAVAVEVEEEVG